MYHKIIVVGNLGRDPEMRYTPNGQAVTSLSVAVNTKYTDSHGKVVKQATWYRVSVWGKMAEACNQYLAKGSLVLVEGTLQADPNTGGPRIWTDKAGNAHAAFEVNASTVRFLVSSGASSGKHSSGLDAAEEMIDDIYIFVGDREEDRLAAEAAQVEFINADNFFAGWSGYKV